MTSLIKYFEQASGSLYLGDVDAFTARKKLVGFAVLPFFPDLLFSLSDSSTGSSVTDFEVAADFSFSSECDAPSSVGVEFAFVEFALLLARSPLFINI